MSGESELDRYEERIQAVMGGCEQVVSQRSVGLFCRHLKARLTLPCEVTGIGTFEWEEPYLLGGGSRREYARLKKTRPCHDDRYELLSIGRGRGSKWMMHAGEDIVAHGRRVGDGQEFDLGLSELKAVDGESPEGRLLEDYAVWFVD